MHSATVGDDMFTQPASAPTADDHTMKHIDTSKLPRDSRGLPMWPRAGGLLHLA